MNPCRTRMRPRLTPPAAGRRWCGVSGWWGGTGDERAGSYGRYGHVAAASGGEDDEERPLTTSDGSRQSDKARVGRRIRSRHAAMAALTTPRGRSRPTRTAAPPPEAQRAHTGRLGSVRLSSGYVRDVRAVDPLRGLRRGAARWKALAAAEVARPRRRGERARCGRHSAKGAQKHGFRE